MKTFPAAFVAEKNKKVGAKPIWIMKLTINSVNYYLSSKLLTIPSFSGSSPWPASTVITTLPIVKTWGSIHQGIANWLSEFQVSEFSATLILNTNYINLESLLLTHPIEDSPVELYEWFLGCSDPPQRLFHGYVRDLTDLTDTTVNLSIQDDTIKLEKSYVGTKVTTALFPSASSADVGKVITIPFGSVLKAPSLVLAGGIQLTLKTSCTTSETTLYVSDVSNTAAGMIFCIDSEQIYVISIGTNYLYVTRAYNSTSATVHAKGASLVQLNAQVYCFSGRAVTSISKVWLKQSDDVFMDISSYCTSYTGQSGNQLSGYGSYGCIQLTSANILSILNVVALSQVDTTGLSDPEHQHTGSQTTLTQYGSNPNWAGSSSDITVITWFYQLGDQVQSNYTVGCLISYTGSTGFTAYIGGQDMGYWASPSRTFTATSGDGVEIRVVANVGTTINGINVITTYRDYTYIPNTVLALTGVIKTGTAQVSGSNMTTYFGSGRIFVDLVSDSNTAEAISNYILTANGMSSIQIVGTLPAYAFSGCITEYQTALWWLNYLALQTQAWFAIVNGSAKLISRYRTTIDKTISACRIGDDGQRMLSRKKTDTNEIINKINLLYDRDWSLNKGDSAYKLNNLVESSTSQTTYSLKEQPSLFQFDFITLATDAVNLNSFYLTNYKDRHWIAEFDVFLDHSELEFGDYLQLSFLNNVCGTVLAASHTPGTYSQIDTIHLTVLIF